LERKRHNYPQRADRLPQLCGIFMFVMGIVTLGGWVFGQLFLIRISQSYVPISPDSALFFVIYGMIMVYISYGRAGCYRKRLVSLLILTSIYGLVQFTDLFFDFYIDWEALLLPPNLPAGVTAKVNMSPYTGLLFLISGISMILYLCAKDRKIWIDFSSVCGLLVMLGGFIASIGYLFGTPFLYGGHTSPLAAITSVCFLFMGCGLVAMSRAQSALMSPFVGHKASARLSRAILPIILVMVLVQGYVIEKGLINEAFFSAMLTLLIMLINSIVIVRMSQSIFSRADKAEQERCRAEQELYHSRQMLQAILDNIPQRVFCKDYQSRYIWCNQAFANDAGFECPEQVVGMNDYDMPWKNYAGVYNPYDARVIKFGESRYHFVEPTILADGNEAWIRISIMPISDPNGAIYGILGVYENITEQHHAEEKLLQAKNDAEAASRAKDEFISTISHELLTPLNGILGFSDLIQEIIPSRGVAHSEEIRSDLRRIHECGESLLRIINDVLDLSKMEAGLLLPTVVEFQPSIVLATTLEMFRVSAEAKHIDLVFTPRNLPKVLIGDSRRLKQILFNLIGNAVKFTETGKVEVVAEWRDGKLYLEVNDTGVGIPYDKQKMIFTPFYQADQSNTRKFGGVGLGLTIVSRMLKMLNGSISFESDPGKGSSFRVVFPAHCEGDV